VNKFAVVVLCVLLLGSTVSAIQNYVYDYNKDGYSGQYARDRRIYDPYSRDRYFGTGYEKPFLNFGSKGPTYAMTNTGAKSAYSSVFNLDTNSLSNQGRDPAHISNFDPRVRGYNRLDRSVDLMPYGIYSEEFANDPYMPKGTARVFSDGNEYGSTLNKPYPRSQIYVQVINLPPVGEDEIYEVWLGDAETEYMLSLGILKSGQGITAQMIRDIYRMVYMFDYVYITREPYPDLDPSPGEYVLMGVMGNIDPGRVDVTPPASNFERVR